MNNKPPTTSAIKPGTAVYATDVTDVTSVTSSTWLNTWNSNPGHSNTVYATDASDVYLNEPRDNTMVIDKLKLSADAELLNERLERIELALGITTRLPTLESTYADLHEAGENMDHVIKHARHINEVVGVGGAYIALTKECEIMEKLKLNNDPEK
jgi:hypothetical protein